jgi:hypothetical protein
MKQYIGPAPLYIRTIEAPFAADADWVDPANAVPDAQCWSTNNVRPQTMAPLTKVLVSFVFLDASGDQVYGTASADIYSFYVNEPRAYSMADGKRPVVRKTDSLSSHNLNEDVVIDVTKHGRMGVRLSSISAPAGATKLQITVQEFA